MDFFLGKQRNMVNANYNVATHYAELVSENIVQLTPRAFNVFNGWHTITQDTYLSNNNAIS